MAQRRKETGIVPSRRAPGIGPVREGEERALSSTFAPPSDVAGMLRLMFMIFHWCGVDLSQVESRRRIILPRNRVVVDAMPVVAAQQLLQTAREWGVMPAEVQRASRDVQEEEARMREEAWGDGLVEYDTLLEDDDEEDRRGCLA